MNKTHSTNVLAINRERLALNKNLKTRKAVGFAIHQLIKARNNTDTEFEKQEYTNVIDTIYDYVYKPLTNSIYENMETIKSSKKWAKKSQHNYDKYCWLRKGVEIKFEHNGKPTYGRILTPVSINDYNETIHNYDYCWICVLTLTPRKTLFGKTKMDEGIVTSVTLDEIYGYYNGNNYISLKQDEIS